jgi:hypothetical protein
MKVIPYPMSAMRISFSICPFTFWWKPSFTKKDLTEFAREQGATLWWARWLWFQISYDRML